LGFESIQPRCQCAGPDHHRPPQVPRSLTTRVVAPEAGEDVDVRGGQTMGAKYLEATDLEQALDPRDPAKERHAREVPLRVRVRPFRHDTVDVIVHCVTITRRYLTVDIDRVIVDIDKPT
jgi:hypothetical protein